MGQIEEQAGAIPGQISDTAPAVRPSGWVVACVVGETIGMTAASFAAGASEGLAVAAALAIVVAGGLVEGIALGVLQAMWIARRFPGVSRRRWVLATVLVAGVGWALASAPSVLSESDGAEPDTALVLIMAAGLGLAMGAVMGVAQALVLRSHVRHGWRWVWISAAAWTPAMVVIFIGATLPDASWPAGTIVALGALTGAVAGAVLGLVSIALMHTLDGTSRRS